MRTEKSSRTRHSELPNEQEENSARLYEAMSLWLDNSGYVNAAKAWKKDAEGEWEHAQWAKDFLLDMGITPKLSTQKEQPTVFLVKIRLP